MPNPTEYESKNSSSRSTSTSHGADEGSIWQSFKKEAATLAILTAIVGGWLLYHQFAGHPDAEVETPAEPSSVASDTLALSPGKLDAAGLESDPARPQLVQEVHTIPGRLRYDPTKHVDIRAPMDGVLSELLVEPGSRVATGDLIAVLRSPEIGRARSEIRKQQQLLELAEQVLQRETDVAKNLAILFEQLDERQTEDDIEKTLAGKALGEHRQAILSAYTQMQLAEVLVDNVRPLVESGSVAGKLLTEREAARQLATNDYRSARDQASFAVQKGVKTAEANVAESQRQVALAMESLENLLGVQDVSSLTPTSDDEESLSRLEVRAPFAGTIESRVFASGERVSRGDSLAVLADTQNLFVEASIRESDWSAVAIAAGTEVTVTVPALDEREFKARVRYFGREVQADTNSVPLVAEIENYEGQLRPGMFVRVTVPKGAGRMVLSVKPQALVQHENQEFVFVDLQEGKFKRVDVATGHATRDWVEVKDGLTEGDLVVTTGAFILKSELLLQGEAE